MREQVARLITGEPEMVNGKPDGLHEMDVDNNLELADSIIALLRKDIIKGLPSAWNGKDELKTAVVYKRELEELLEGE